MGNSARQGGGIRNGGDLAIAYSIFIDNSATANGGGIASFGELTLDHSILPGNFAPRGGDLYNAGIVFFARQPYQ